MLLVRESLLGRWWELKLASHYISSDLVQCTKKIDELFKIHMIITCTVSDVFETYLHLQYCTRSRKKEESIEYSIVGQILQSSAKP